MSAGPKGGEVTREGEAHQPEAVPDNHPGGEGDGR